MTDAPDAGSHAGSHDASKGELADSAWFLANNGHPPEYHIRRWQDGNDEEDDEEDYSPGISSCSIGLTTSSPRCTSRKVKP